ncbi:zinc-binding dehydrogenase, partial [Actinomadura fibrosa]
PHHPTTTLPTYPFQHHHYWLTPPSGTEPALDHPFLHSATESARDGTLILTGRIALAPQGWLADHTVHGIAVVPGTALLDLALQAAARTGYHRLDELVLRAALILPERSALDLQVVVRPPDSDDRRVVTVHARQSDAAEWNEYAAGTLSKAVASPSTAGSWPPPDASPVDADALYQDLLARGLSYGPAFRFDAAWRDGNTAYTEIAVPPGTTDFTLLDLALHPAALLAPAEGSAQVPFAWRGVHLHSTGSTALRVRAAITGEAALSVTVVDDVGEPVLDVESLTLRPMAGDQLAAAADAPPLHRLRWRRTSIAPRATGSYSVLDGDDLTSLTEPVPAVVVARIAGDGSPEGAHGCAERALGLLRAWLADERFATSRLLLVTRGATSVRPGDRIGDLAAAPAWGLVRSARTEHPDRFAIADLDQDVAECGDLVTAAVLAGIDEIAVREGHVLLPEVVRMEPADVLTAPDGDPWRLELTGEGGLDGLALVSRPESARPLRSGEIRVAIRAGGLSFHDVVTALGMVRDGKPLAGEGAGVVTDVGPDVAGLARGDRVMGLLTHGLGQVTITDHRLVVPIPPDWSYAQAATVPVAFLTAAYTLGDLAGLRPGQRLLIHAAAGGVGMAALQLARLRNADIYTTASPAKWTALRGLGVEPDRIASSRTTEYGDRFRTAGGFDAVLNCLTGTHIDVSLGLLAPGGRFVELGKSDIRDADEIASAAHPGVTYQTYDILDPGTDRLHALLAELAGHFAEGTLSPLPVTAFDVRQAPDAFRHVAQARHTGKVVLTFPDTLDPEGTVLITGGTGTLGSLVADHLVRRHGVRHLVLAGRHARTSTRTTGGATVTTLACDTADPEALAALLADIPA